MKEITEKLAKFFEIKGLSQKDVADKMGTSATYINAIFNDRKAIGKKQAEKMENLFGLSSSWLLTGKGEMLRDTTELPEDLKSDSALVLDKDFRLVPIIHIDSVGGIHSSNDIVDETEYVEGHVPFVGAREDDRAIYQSGESMIPTIPPGSLMQIREVVGWREFFGYGDIFVLLLTDGRRITKEVTRYDANPKEYVWCVSHNPNVPDEELPRSMIVRVWKVIKVLTDKGW